MANKYADHGLYAAYSAAPTFGTCQDGDGAAVGAASAATVSIDLSAYTAAAGALLSIGGATLTCVASGAAANQFNAGSGATLAANLATAINQTSNTNVINTATGGAGVNPMYGWPITSKLQDFCYAVATGSTLQIQSRVGSAALNATSYFAAVSSGLTGGAQINASFANGASGAWGYVFNHLIAIWKSQLILGAYGLWAANKPFAGALDPGDRVKVRANKTLTLVPNNSFTMTSAIMGTAANPVVFEIDDGTMVPAWAGDGPNPVFKMSFTTTGNNAFTWQSQTLCYAHIKGKRYGYGQYSLVFEGLGNGPTLPTLNIIVGGSPIIYEGFDMYAPAGSTASPCLKLTTGAGLTIGTQVLDARIHWSTHNNVTYMLHNGASNGAIRVQLRDVEFVQLAPTVAQNPVIQPVSGGGSLRLEFKRCKFTGFVPGSRLMSSMGINQSTLVQFENCDFGTITHRGPNTALIAATSSTYDAWFASSNVGQRDFFIDSRSGFCEWNSSKSYPVMTAKLLDGVTGWVIYAVPTTVAANIGRNTPFETPNIEKYNTLPTGDRTVTVSIALESSTTWTQRDISAYISYVDSTGRMRCVNTFDVGAGALASDASNIGSWSSNNGVNVTYNSQQFVPLKFSAVLADCAAGCVITTNIRFHTSVANETLGCFIDPELRIA